MKYCKYCPHVYEDDDNALVVISHNLKCHEDIFSNNLPWNQKE